MSIDLLHNLLLKAYKEHRDPLPLLNKILRYQVKREGLKNSLKILIEIRRLLESKIETVDKKIKELE